MTSLVLLSGGMDSALCLALEREAGREVRCLGIDYGARHNARELRAAAAVAAHYEAPFATFSSPFPAGWGGTLMDGGRSVLAGAATVVSGRNLILIGLAVGYAQDHGCARVVVGCNATDRDLFRDCRREFLGAASVAAQLGYGVTVEAPLIDLTKAQILARGNALGVPWDLTYSCYRGEEETCQVCGACWVRQQAELHLDLEEQRAARRARSLVQIGTAPAGGLDG